VFSPTNIPNGNYNIGVACTLGAASATQLKSYWSQQITITNDPSNTDNAKVDWVVSTPEPTTTTTTAAPTTTTTAAPTTTTTIGQSTTTTTIDPLGGTGSTSVSGDPTGTFVSSSGGGLPVTGGGVWSLLFWAVVLLVAGRMMYLVGKSPKSTDEVG